MYMCTRMPNEECWHCPLPQIGVDEAASWVQKLLNGAPRCLFIIQVGPNANAPTTYVLCSINFQRKWHFLTIFDSFGIDPPHLPRISLAATIEFHAQSLCDCISYSSASFTKIGGGGGSTHHNGDVIVSCFTHGFCD